MVSPSVSRTLRWLAGLQDDDQAAPPPAMPSYNDPTSGGTLSQPLPPSPAAPSAPWSLSDAVAPVRSAVSSAVGPAAAAYGGAFERVNREEDAAAARNREAITNPALQAAIAPLEAIRRATRLGTAAVEATPEAIRETANAAATPLGLGREDVGVDLPWVGRTGITDAALALAPSDRAQAIMNAAGGMGRAPVGPAAGAVAGALEAGGEWAASRVRGAIAGGARRVGSALAGGAAPVLTPGLRNAAYNAAQGAFLGAASEELQAGQEGRPADYGEEARRALIGGGLAAVAGNRGAREAVTHALGAGFVPRGPTVEVLQDALGAVRRRVQEARQAVGAAATREEHQAASAAVIQAQAEEGRVLEQLQQARQQRRSLEPRISAEVGPRLQDAGSALGPADAEMLADARYPRDRVPSDMRSSIGPVDDAPRTASVGSGFVPAEDAMRASDGTSPGQAAEREAARAHLSPVARRVVGAYDLETPRRAAAVADRAVQIAADGIARKIPRRGGMEGSPHELMARVHEAVVRNLDDTKVVMTGLNPGALRAFLGGQGLTSKAETGDLGLINQITQGQVNVAGGRAKLVDGKKVTVPYTLEDAADFAQRESEQMRGVTGGTRFPDPQTGAIDREAPRVLYAYVSEGQPLVGPNVPTLGLVWKPQTPRVSSVNHPFGAFSRGQDIHVNMAGGNKALVYDPAAIAGARHAPAAMSGGRLVEAPRGAPTSGDLAFDWERAGIDVGDGRKIADTHLLVGADGESSHRASALVSGMSNDLQAAIARGTMDDPEQVAAVLMRGGAPKWKPGWGAVQNPTRTESLILDPDLANVQAIYITGLRKNLERNLEGGGKTGERITELDMARRIRAAIMDQTGEDVPILYNDIGRQAVSAPNVKAGLGSNEGWAPTLISDAEVLEGPPLTLSPGRQRIVDEYTQATDPATGKPYMNLGGQVPFDPSGAALGAGAGAASEDDQGQQADPWRTAGGLVMGGVLGKRFPAAAAWYRRASARNAAEMAARNIAPASAADVVRSAASSVGHGAMLGPSTAGVNTLQSLWNVGWALPKEPLRAAGRAISTGNASALREPGEMAFGAARGMTRLGEAVWDVVRGAGKYAPVPGHEPTSAKVADPFTRALLSALEAPGRVFGGLPDAISGTIAEGSVAARRAAQKATDAGLSGADWEDEVDRLVAEAEAHRKAARAGSTAAPSDPDVADVVGAADKAGERAGLRQPLGTIGTAARKVAKLGDAPVIGEFVAPYFNSPWNAMLQQAERTPAGFVMNTQGSKFDKHYDAVVGSAAALALGDQLRRGNITVNGSGPTDPNERQAWTDRGNRPYSIKVGDRYVPNRVFGYAEGLLNAVGEYHDALAYRKPEADSRWVQQDAFARIGRLLKEQPYAAGYATIADMAQHGPAALAADLATRFTPGSATMRAIGTSQDPSERAPDRGAGVPLEEEAYQRWQQSVGLRSGLPVAQDILGRPKENPQQGAAAFFPRAGVEKRDPVIEAFQEARVFPGDPPRTLSGAGVTDPDLKPELSPAEQRRWNEIRGEGLIRKVQPLIDSGKLASGTPEQRAKALEDAKRAAADYADVTLAREIGRDELVRRYEARKARKAAS